jgi:Family of unknown function (DUF5336)
LSDPTGQGFTTPPTGPAYGHPARDNRGLPHILTIAVAALGILNFLLGFAPYDSTDGTEVPGVGIVGVVSGNFFQSGTGGLTALALLLAGGLVAGGGLLPRQTPSLVTIAGLSIAGVLTLLSVVAYFPDRVNAGIGLILMLICGIVQAAGALAALLLEARRAGP